MTSVYLDELVPGMSASTEHTVTERDVQLFGEATGDMNPVHFDEEFARKTVFRGRVAHGALSIGFISALLGTKLPGDGSIFLSASIVFKLPVRIGDTVVTTATVREINGRALDPLSRWRLVDVPRYVSSLSSDCHFSIIAGGK